MGNRVFDMCDVCKLDKNNLCDYDCVKRREDFVFRFHTCPRFIYDDKKPITNAEMLSTKLKDDIEKSACAIKYVNKEFKDTEDLIRWLKSDAEFYEGKI